MRAYATRLITVVGICILWQANNKVGADPDELLNGFIQFGKEFLEKMLLQWRVPQLINDGNGQLSFQVDSSNNLETPCPTCRPGMPQEMITGTWTIVMVSRNLLITRLAELDRILARLERNQPASQHKTFLEWINGAPDMRCAQLSVLNSMGVSKYEIGYRLAANGRQRTVVGNWLRDETGTYIWELPAPISSVRFCISFHGYLQNAVEYDNSPLEFPQLPVGGHVFGQSNNNLNTNNDGDLQLLPTTTTLTTTALTKFENNATIMQKQHEIDQLERNNTNSEKPKENEQQQIDLKKQQKQLGKNEDSLHSDIGTLLRENDSTSTTMQSSTEMSNSQPNHEVKDVNIQNTNNLTDSGGIDGNIQNLSKLIDANRNDQTIGRDQFESNEYRRININATNKSEKITSEKAKPYEYKPKIFTADWMNKSETFYGELAVNNATMQYGIENDNLVQLSSVITRTRLANRRKCTHRNRTKKSVHRRSRRWATSSLRQPVVSPLLSTARLQSQLSVDGLTMDASNKAAQPAVSRILPASAANGIDMLGGDLTQFLVLNQVDSSPMPCDNFIVLARFGSARVDSDQMLAKIAQIREFLERERIESVFNKLERIHCY